MKNGEVHRIQTDGAEDLSQVKRLWGGIQPAATAGCRKRGEWMGGLLK